MITGIERDVTDADRRTTLEDMWRVVEIILILLLPTIAGAGLIAGMRGAGTILRWQQQRARGLTGTQRLPIEQVAATARRLHRELSTLDSTVESGPGRGLRMSALRSAYVDSLCEACEALDIAVPGPDGSTQPPRIFALEKVLRDGGLDVRPPAVR